MPDPEAVVESVPAAKLLGRTSVWLVAFTTALYVACIEPAYKSDSVCQAERWTRVVVAPPLTGVPEPVIAIGSNAGYVIVVSGAECPSPEQNGDRENGDRENGDRENAWLTRLAALQQVRDRGAFLYELLSGKVDFWETLWPGRAGSGEPRAAVVPLSRVLCMYDVPSSNPNRRPACKQRPPEPGPPGPPGPPGGADARSEERLRREVRNKLAEQQNPECRGEPPVSPAIVFRPNQSALEDETEVAQVARAVAALNLEGDAAGVKLYVFGFASADGRPGHNDQLSRQRAEHVRGRLAEIKQRDGREWNVATEPFAMGEDHLANGVAESRAARLVACF